MEATTPTKHRRIRELTLATIRELRARCVEIRRLRATGRVLDAEDAEGLCDMLRHDHNLARASLRWLRTVGVRKNSHLSPRAAARAFARYG